MFFLEQNCCECFQMDYLQTLKWSWVECINGAFNLATTHPRSPLDGQYIVNISTTEELARNTQIHKYSNTQIHTYTNTQIHKYTGKPVCSQFIDQGRTRPNTLKKGRQPSKPNWKLRLIWGQLIVNC